MRYDPDGKVERRLRLPVQQVSSLIFGGPNLTDLYITSASEAWPSQEQPPLFIRPAQWAGRSTAHAPECKEACPGLHVSPPTSHEA